MRGNEVDFDFTTSITVKDQTIYFHAEITDKPVFPIVNNPSMQLIKRTNLYLGNHTEPWGCPRACNWSLVSKEKSDLNTHVKMPGSVGVQEGLYPPSLVHQGSTTYKPKNCLKASHSEEQTPVRMSDCLSARPFTSCVTSGQVPQALCASISPCAKQGQ